MSDLIVFGLGKMGLSIARGLASDSNLPCRIQGIASSEEKAKQFCQTEKFPVFGEFTPKPSDRILIAVKPFQFPELKQQIAAKLSSANLIISVMAGISTHELQTLNSGASIIRVMPNTPCIIGESASVLFAPPKVPEESITFVESLFRRLGKTVKVEREELIDACTAISGSGPAYVFYLAEQMIESAKEFGIDEQSANLLVRQTFAGAGLLMRGTEESVADLRKNVTSPKGTTQAATDCFDEHSMKEIIRKGCQKAFERARQLAKS